MDWCIRLAGDADMGAFAEIVNHYIATTVIHLGGEPQRADDWRAEWLPLRDRYPWLVAERAGLIGGIAYAKPFNARRAYDWSAEVTIYLRDGLRGQGIGSALYGRLFAMLDAQGYRSSMAGVTLPNPASVAIHARFGFQPVGALRRAGYKQGAWHDVGLFQRLASSEADAPEPIRPVAAVAAE